MTPRRRQGSGRAALDHIAAGLTDALSTLSKVTAAQTIIADVARGDVEKAKVTLERLDTPLLDAVLQVTTQLQTMLRTEQHARINDEWLKAHPPCRCQPSCRCRLNADPPCRCTEGESP